MEGGRVKMHTKYTNHQDEQRKFSVSSDLSLNGRRSTDHRQRFQPESVPVFF